MKSPSLFPFLLHSFPPSLNPSFLIPSIPPLSRSYSVLFPSILHSLSLSHFSPSHSSCVLLSSLTPRLLLSTSISPPPSLLLLPLPLSSFLFPLRSLSLSPTFPYIPFLSIFPLCLTPMVTGVVLLYFQSCDLVSLLCHRY